MRIAYITYEYPPDIAQGGIATYVQQAAQIMINRRHSVEIFCASNTRSISEIYEGILVHRSNAHNPKEFQNECLAIFEERHLTCAFDIIECPEIHGNALKIKFKFPQIPLVVKLHMPLFFQMRIYNFYTPYLTKLRFFLGGLKRGRLSWYGNYNYTKDVDYQITKMADGIVSPSISLKNILSKEWKLDSETIEVIPNPFQPSKKALDIVINKNIISEKVTFIGKLNVHKGIVNLIKAIPLVVKKHPKVVFVLVGNDSYFGVKRMMMSQYIHHKLKDFKNNYEIKGAFSYDQILNEFQDTSVCIFPSIWENFPMVCLEAMSAGKAIIGSKQGGMNEMLSDDAGVIIDPLNVNHISSSIIKLLSNKNLRDSYGKKARETLINKYNGEMIGTKMENYFEKIIQKKINNN